MKPLYIFDLDGTLALIHHRRPILDDLSNPHRWDDFYKACVRDEPNKPVIEVLNNLIGSTQNQKADIKIFSGRSDLVAIPTVKWLSKHVLIGFGDFYCANVLRMRKQGDNTPDQELKRKWLYELSKEDRARLAAVFDDRQKVVDMWRSEGVICFQVAKGDF